MMNHMPNGPGGPQPPPPQQPHNISPVHPHHVTPQRRDYHSYAPSPQQQHSPMHPPPYMNYHAAPYYPLPQQHNPYAAPPPRWQYPQQHYQPPPPFIPQGMPMSPYPPPQQRSPMMMSPPHRPNLVSHHSQGIAQQSPRPMPQYMHYQPPTPGVPSPSAGPFIPAAEIAAAAAAAATAAAATPPPPPPPVEVPESFFNPAKHVPSEEYKSPLPWYFPPGEGQSTFPKASVPRRRRRRVRRTPNVAVDLPESKERSHMASNVDVAASGLQPITVSSLEKVQESLATPEKSAEGAPSESSTIAARSEPETPATSHPPSETDYLGGGGAGGATAAGNAAAASPETPKPFHSQPQQHQQTRRDTRSAIAVPNISGLPKNNNNKPVDATTLTSPPPGTAAVSSSENDRTPKAEDQISVATGESAAAAPDAASQASSQPAPVPVAKSWADLVRRNAKPTAAAAAGATGVSTLSNGEALTNGFHAGGAASKTASLGDALKQYSVQHDTTLSFLEPRGLVNTGNMCYMNSILQVLVFCAPFYSFLDHVRHRTVHSLSQRASRTPLIDAMILFMREFKVLAHAESPDALRKVLRAEQLEVYGEPVTPEYVYDVIRTLPTFAHMRRGHQQDAEEFLGFLLEGLHDECAGVMAQGQTSGEPVAESADASSAPADPSESNTTTTTVDGWQEVGPKQKSALTRTAGTPDPPSPITKIFGGHLRSELRVPGLQTSAVYEPFKPLQLDIGAPDVHNIVDALRGLTRIESLDGSFGGRTNATAKKQVFIHDLPEVLILHLKRFQYDLTGTQKIWKKVGYPLELEIPKEVFAPAERKSLALKGGMPRYRLIGVVYHHGKSAAGGHYTVDVRRQDGREWVRMDDTFIRRVRAEEVAAAGAEEEGAKVTTTTAGSKSHDEIAAAAVRASQPTQTQRNMYHGLDDAEDEEDGADDDDASGERRRPWEEVNGTARPTSASAAAATTNGTSPASTTLPNGHNHNHKSAAPLPLRKENVRDNKVAYILLYERMRV